MYSTNCHLTGELMTPVIRAEDRTAAARWQPVPQAAVPRAAPPAAADAVTHTAFSLGADDLGGLLDELDQGVVVVDMQCRVLFVNASGRQVLRGGHPLVLEGLLHARTEAHARQLAGALDDAVLRGLRRMLSLDHERQRHHVAVVPLAPQADGTRRALLLLGRQRSCEALSLYAFARSAALSPSESEVLSALSSGEEPAQAARRMGVSIATVRTHIAAIRAKTRTPTIRALLLQLATLPPMVSALRQPGPR